MNLYTYTTTVTEAQVKRGEEWKALADEYGLDIDEMYELAFHVKKIKDLLDKKSK